MDEPVLVLVPGFWLGAWAWDEVADDLRAEGTAVTAVTLPGLAPGDDPATVTWSDQVDALLEVVRRSGPGTVLVAHSGGGSVATGVLDRAPDAVRRVVYVDSGPAADGRPYDPGVGPEADAVPLPSFAELAARGASLEGLDEERLATFRRRARPQPAGVLREVVALHDDRRDAVPSTFVNCSFRTEQVRAMTAAGVPMFVPVARLRDATHLDLPTGHWPMFSRPHDLAAVLRGVARG